VTAPLVDLDPASALEPSARIDSDHPAIRGRARALTQGTTDSDEVVGALFAYVRDAIAYDMAPDLSGDDPWRASDTLARRRGFCQQKAVLLAALLRAAGIPAALSFQVLRSHQIPPHYAEFLGGQDMDVHGLNLVHLGGVWRRIDATLDRALCDRRGYRLVEYRPGDDDLLLPKTTLSGDQHFEIIEELGHYLDVPEDLARRTIELEFLHDAAYQAMVHRKGAGA
jgi:transglutaminase-like putative cysteine protease